MLPAIVMQPEMQCTAYPKRMPPEACLQGLGCSRMPIGSSESRTSSFSSLSMV